MPRGRWPSGEAEALLARLEAGDAEAAEELLAYVQEYHALDRRILRTRRSSVRALGTLTCRRRVEVLAYGAPLSEAAVCEHVERLPDATALAPPQLGLCGIYRQAACTTPLLFLALLRARAKAIEHQGQGEASTLELLPALARDPGPSEAEFLRRRTVASAPPLPGERAWLQEAIRLTRAWLLDAQSGCARFRAASEWIVSRVRRGRGRKVLVFAQDREEVTAFSDHLREQLGVDAVGALHHAVDEMQVSELALRFQQPGGLRVLVSDDLGGDGRNFQIASALVHLNQPWSVSRVEQRVGRLDRMGRDPAREVLSVVLAGPSPTEQALLQLHLRVFEVYEQSLGGLEFLLPDLQRAMFRAACDGAPALEALREPFRAEVRQERAAQAETAAEAMASTRRQLDEASELAEILAATDGADGRAGVTAWARALGMRLLDDGPHRVLWRWRWEHLRRVPPGLAPPDAIPAEGRVSKRGTFSRAEALDDESLEFFAPGHPIVDALARDVLDSADGRATAFSCELGLEHRGGLFLHAVIRSSLDAAGSAAYPGLRYRALARLWPQVRSVWLLLRPGQGDAAVVVRDRGLLRRLDGHDADTRQRLDPDDLARALDPRALWEAVDAGVDLALATFRNGRAPEIGDAVETLREDFARDVRYVEGVLRRGDAQAREAARDELEAREAVLAAVAQEQTALQALALVIGR
jgi:hypothetical protein